MGSSQTRARTRVPCIGRQILNHCATREARKIISEFGLKKRKKFGVCWAALALVLEKLPTQEEKGDKSVGLLLPRSRCPLLSLGKENTEWGGGEKRAGAGGRERSSAEIHMGSKEK